MKIRIKGNTLRIRLSQSEIDNLKKTGNVKECTEFPAGNTFCYQVVESNKFECSFKENMVTVELDSEHIKEWVNSDQVSIGGDLNLEKDAKLSILVEKDFKCLTERPEDESDMFPNPLKNHC